LEAEGGLDVTQGPDGSLFVVKSHDGKVIYYKADELPWTTLKVKSVFPRKGPESGGSLLTLHGESFDTFGKISRTIKDKNGTRLVNVSITLLDSNENVVATMMTGPTSKSEFTGVPFGEYYVETTNPTKDS
jgi:hypothetical protein